MSTTLPVGSSSAASSSTSSTTGSAALSLSPTDFLNMMVTQLQNQDPLQPTSSSDLLAQMSQIGQLQSSTQLQTSLASFGLQTSISAASSMLGKQVTGLDTNQTPASGVVTAVQVQSGNVSLELDSGQSLPLGNVTSIVPAPSGTKSATPAAS